MAGVPEAYAAHLPASHYFAKCPRRIEEGLSRTKRELINCIDRNVVPNIENARTFVAMQTVDGFRSIRLAAANRAIVDGMGPGVAALERQPLAETALKR